MKKGIKRLLASVLVALMVISVAPMSEIAKLNFDWLKNIDFSCLDFGVKSNALGSSGQCGYNVNYTFDSSTGTLTISGTGEMYNYLNYYYDYSPFNNNPSIKKVIIESGVTCIGDFAFYGCAGLTSVTIPNSVTSIKRYAFSYCAGLTSITIPDSVTSIGDGAFLDCRELKSITIPDSVTSIGDYAFYYCTGLTSITIPNSVTSIGSYAFYYCTGLTSITIPNSVTSIGDYAFEWCTGLTSITIPNSVTSIGKGAFEECTGLTSITIPNSVTSIGNWTFRYCTGLTSITIPNSVTSIGDYAFYRCTGLTSITIPNSVTSIGKGAFEECTGLTSITIPNSVTSIGNHAFEWCTGLTSITVDSNNKVYDSRNNCNAIIETKTDTLIFGCKNTVIPNSVTSIGDYAFSGCNGLTSITIPNSVTSIGDYAFAYCTGLTSISVDSNNKVYDSRNNCNAIIKTKTNTLIAGCKNTTIPNSVTSIGWYAFYGCIKLTSITIPNSVTSIGDYAFSGCNGLTSITIPNSVTSIGDYAFAYCTGLTSITIPNSVTSIGMEAFYYCTGLTSVIIPESVKSIGNIAFYGCTGLKNIYYLGTKSQWGSISKGSSAIPSGVVVIFSNLNYTQTHTVDDYASKNKSFGKAYLSSAGTALDGKNSGTSMVIPGLKKGENMVPQGIAYYPNKNQVLITAYYKDGTDKKKPSMIFALDYDTGSLVEEYVLKDSSGKDITGHVGGIAVSGNNIYVANGKSIYYFSSADMGGGVAKAKDEKKIFGEITGLKKEPNCAYVTINDGVLWTGNFYDGSDKDFNKPATSEYNSIILGFDLTGSGNKDEWDNFNSKNSADHTYYVSNELENIQCATVFNGYICLTTSFGRRNQSRVYYGNTSRISSKITPSKLDSMTGLPMMEGFFIKDGYMYTICESAAYFYNGYEFYNMSKDPTDVVWKVDLSKIVGSASGEILGDITDKDVSFVIDKEKGSTTLNFKQSWFNNDSSFFNGNLGRFCSQFAMIGYDDGDKSNLRSALETIGMEDNIKIEPEAGREEVNYFLANRKINVNGKQYTLVFAGFIGSYLDQWYSNFDPGTGDTHKGFNNAKNYVMDKLDDYIKSLGVSKDNLKILITGHSRGAATANLVAADLIKNQQYATAENIYTYAFATPNVTTLPERNDEQYKRIFNIVNPEDFVTKVMLNGWDYGRYGTTYTLPSKTQNSGYANYLNNMQNYFTRFTGDKYEPFEKGEEATYNVIQSMYRNCPTVSKMYKEDFKYHNKKISIQQFFNDTLCKYCASKKGSMQKYEAIAELGSAFAIRIGTSPAILDIVDYFMGNNNGIWADYFEDAHRAETYCAFMMSMSDGQLTEDRYGYYNSVNCPVDVEVYDKATGELVGRIVDNVVDETVAAKENSIVMTVEGESKQFWIPSDGDYEIKLIGNDTGKMDYTVSTFDNDGNEVTRSNFFDVNITDGFTMTGDMGTDDFVLEEYNLKLNDSNTITPATESNDVKITVNAGANGSATESFTAKAGDYVTVSAMGDEGYCVEGWYINNELVSDDVNYSFVAKENVTVEAEFIPDKVTSFGFDTVELYMQARDYCSLIYKVYPKNVSNKNVRWTSSNDRVASVDENGCITAHRLGKATITGVTEDGEYTDSVDVFVKYSFGQWLIIIFLFGWIWYK